MLYQNIMNTKQWELSFLWLLNQIKHLEIFTNEIISGQELASKQSFERGNKVKKIYNEAD